MSQNLIVRYGPAPEDTADADGNLHAVFTDTSLVQLGPDEAGAMFGGPGGREPTDPDGLVRLAAAAWIWGTREGHGHMLVGAYSRLGQEDRVARPCGLADDYSVAPQNYVPLYAVARGRAPGGDSGDIGENDENGGNGAPGRVDVGVDYRGTEGPGDEDVRPVIFDAEAIIAGGRRPAEP